MVWWLLVEPIDVREKGIYDIAGLSGQARECRAGLIDGALTWEQRLDALFHTNSTEFRTGIIEVAHARRVITACVFFPNLAHGDRTRQACSYSTRLAHP